MKSLLPYIAVISFLFLFPPQCNCMEMKIGLLTSKDTINIKTNNNASLLTTVSKKEITKLRKNENIKLNPKDNLITVLKEDKIIGTYKESVILIPTDKNTLVAINNNWYRGKVLALIRKGMITIVNQVDLEDYLLSVVPSEMPKNWHIEALKAQSVAARSYAVGFVGRRKEKGYDLESSIEDQLYLGVKSETNKTTKAVHSTEGLILLGKNDKPLIALFHSSGGGYTDRIEDIWDLKKRKDIKPSVHIQPKPDFDQESPHFHWSKTYNLSSINIALKDLKIGSVKNLKLLSKSQGGRISKLKIIGTERSTVIWGDDFRRSIGLPSAMFEFNIKEKITFTGSGYGHGLGLSQWGAKAQAEAGKTFQEILAYYYPGTKLTRINDFPKIGYPCSKTTWYYADFCLRHRSSH